MCIFQFLAWGAYAMIRAKFGYTPLHAYVCTHVWLSVHMLQLRRVNAVKGSLRLCSDFYRAKLRVARYCHGMLSVCPSVCPSKTLRYRDHIRSNSAKIISPLISLTISLSADPNTTDLLQREHPQILAGIGVE